ncbi:Hypothetical predicted protein [Paramuricea clavata]|uniref:Uncharacterized protein n=1 Tax=Paramuricea clavata TaxID=317549 RepID=A0A6S7G0P4_PARCT|nr:Hypothetical predicted protein [Paramuricea clavata]
MAVPQYQDKLVVLFGGLRISMCFLKTIGDHRNGSGLAETWVENDVFTVFLRFFEYTNENLATKIADLQSSLENPVQELTGTLKSSEFKPFLDNWPNFLALPEKKADLARSLSEHLIPNAPPDKVIVVTGGFNDGEKAQCSNEEMDLTIFYKAHEKQTQELFITVLQHL